MVTMRQRSVLMFAGYALVVIGFLVFMGHYITEHRGHTPPLLGYLLTPGLLVSVCTVGVHSDSFLSAAIAANIIIFLAVPLLYLFLRDRRRRTMR